MDEVIERGLRQFADRAEEAIVARASRERAEIGLQASGVPGSTKRTVSGLAAAERRTSEYCRRSSR